MKKVLLFSLISFFLTKHLSAQCGSNATFVGSTSLVSGSGNGTPGNPYTAGSVLKVTITVGGTYLQIGSNWWHGIQINLGSNFTFASPLNFSRTGFPGSNGKWKWSYGLTGDGPGSAGPGIYYDSDNDGDPSNNYGVNTLSLSGTLKFNIVVTGTNTNSATISANITSDGFSGAWATGSCDADALAASAMTVLNNIALPVSLVSVKAKKSGTNDVEINWETATEQNVSHFDIEYSTDGRNWIVAGTRNAVGNSNTLQQYSFLHKNVPGGDLYYRIKSVDRDSRYEFSKVVSIKEDFTTDYFIKNVYPNPAKDKLSIQIISPEESTGSLVIYNSAGAAVMKSSEAVQKGLNEISLDLSALQSGIYLIRFSNSSANINYKLVKQ